VRNEFVAYFQPVTVMAGRGPAIHVFGYVAKGEIGTQKDVDGSHKGGHDVETVAKFVPHLIDSRRT